MLLLDSKSCCLCEDSRDSGLAGFGQEVKFQEVKIKPGVRNPDKQVC